MSKCLQCKICVVFNLIKNLKNPLVQPYTHFEHFVLQSVILMGFDLRLDAVNCKRVNVAGSQAASYLQRLLQLKYPGHLAAITLSRMEELLHEHSYTAVNYHEGTYCQCKHT